MLYIYICFPISNLVRNGVDLHKPSSGFSCRSKYSESYAELNGRNLNVVFVRLTNELNLWIDMLCFARFGIICTI